MAPIICIRIPDFGLQILARRLNRGSDLPLITVREDRPAARVTACNAAAVSRGVRPGMRYAQALSLDRTIRAGVVTPEERKREMDEVEALLYEIVPTVERSRFEEGLFWIPTDGITQYVEQRYHRQPELVLKEKVESSGRRVCVASAHSRIAGTVATAARHTLTAENRMDEWQWVLAQPLAALPVPAGDAERFRFLGLRTIGDLAELPEGQLRRRMSSETVELYRFLQDERRVSSVKPIGRRSLARHYRFEHRVTSTEQLSTIMAPIISSIIAEAEAAALWIESVRIEITGEMPKPWHQEIGGGAATRDANALHRLIALRLEAKPPAAEDLSTMEIVALCIPGREAQGELIPHDAPLSTDVIDHARLEEAVATLRAELGDQAVVRMLPGDHLVPEFRVRRLRLGSGRPLLNRHDTDEVPSTVDGVFRIRRIEIDGPQLSTGGARRQLWGPFLLSSRWWRGPELERIYRYRRDEVEFLWWEFTTPGSQRLYRQGKVE